MPVSAPWGRLRGHLSRPAGNGAIIGRRSKRWRFFESPQAYISPKWYPTKQENGRLSPHHSNHEPDQAKPPLQHTGATERVPLLSQVPLQAFSPTTRRQLISAAT